MRKAKLFAACGLALVMVFALVSCERKVTNETTIIVSGEGNAKYVGSDQCSACHSAIWDKFMDSGHPYKLNKAADAQQPGYYPFGDLESPPSGYSWDQISYVIGGFRWKARFIDLNGYIITGDDGSAITQWNLPTEDAPAPSWVGYHAGQDSVQYKCGPCHMTAYDPVGHQDGLPGMIGTWALDGVQCEECHGPGENHVAAPGDFGMKIDRSNEQCGKCHIRGPVSHIPAKGGFIKHHEQWNEIFAGKHLTLQCVDCHDPHEGLHEKRNEADRAKAIRSKCENCHFEQATAYAESGLPHGKAPLNIGCIECHMPKAAKSAQKVGTYKGDVRSHLFAINTDPNATLIGDDGYANGYLTLDFVCLQCHTDDSKNIAWAASYASSVHPVESAGEFATCFGCHDDQSFDVVAAQQQWANSKHALGDNINRNRNYKSYYRSCEKCHTNEGFIAEVTGVPADGEHFTSIACFTCHAPHTNGNLNLRVTDAVILGNGMIFDRGPANLCASCHQSRRDVNTYVYDGVELSTHFGPHYSNQADMLIATGGYEYEGFEYSSSAHAGSATEACIDCHMTGSQANLVGGHTWNMHNEERNLENLTGCNIDACHGVTGKITELNRLASDDFDGDGTTEGVQDEIEGLEHQLRDLLLAAGLIEGSEQDGYHPTADRVVSTADSVGAVYNWAFIEDDRSGGVHNTKYAVALLQSSINFMTAGGPGGGVAVLDVGTASQAPIIDGSIDAVWANAEAFNITAGASAAYQNIFGEVDLLLKAVTYSDKLYVLAQWTDPSGTENIQKSRWEFSAGAWAKGSGNEDRFFLMFDGGDNGTEKANCATMCHVPGPGEMGTTGGGHVDVWHWKAARTNPGNHADDKWWDATGRGSDAKDNSLYTDNTQEVEGANIPLYMHSTGTAYTGDFLFEADKVAFDPELDWTGKTIPYYVINPEATGSRWDVQAKGVYDNGVWTLELARDLNNGNADDVVLGSGTIRVTAAITDNSGGSHSGTVPFDLKF